MTNQFGRKRKSKLSFAEFAGVRNWKHIGERKKTTVTMDRLESVYDCLRIAQFAFYIEWIEFVHFLLSAIESFTLLSTVNATENLKQENYARTHI